MAELTGQDRDSEGRDSEEDLILQGLRELRGDLGYGEPCGGLEQRRLAGSVDVVLSH